MASPNTRWISVGSHISKTDTSSIATTSGKLAEIHYDWSYVTWTQIGHLGKDKSEEDSVIRVGISNIIWAVVL